MGLIKKLLKKGFKVTDENNNTYEGDGIKFVGYTPKVKSYENNPRKKDSSSKEDI